MNSYKQSLPCALISYMHIYDVMTFQTSITYILNNYMQNICVLVLLVILAFYALDNAKCQQLLNVHIAQIEFKHLYTCITSVVV